MKFPSSTKIVTTVGITLVVLVGVFWLANRGNKLGLAVVNSGRKAA